MKRLLFFALLIMAWMPSFAQEEFDESELYGNSFDVETASAVYRFNFYEQRENSFDNISYQPARVDVIVNGNVYSQLPVYDYFVIGGKIHMDGGNQSFVFTLVRDEEGNIVFKPRNYNKDTESVAAPSKSRSEASEIGRYSVNGEKINGPQKGINIVKMSDNSSKKELVR